MTSERGSRSAGVVGWPIDHSRSPIIHRHWLEKYKIAGTYDRRAVPPDQAESFFGDFKSNGWVGCNVTVPHKETAYRLAHHRHPSADAVQAANTLWLEGDQLCAENTDTYGFMKHLDVSVPSWRETSTSVLILGAGGAARAIAYGFAQAGIERITIANRTARRAIELAQAVQPVQIKPAAWEERQKISETADIIINTTTLGMAKSDNATADTNQLGLDLSRREKPDPAIVSDIVYVPLQTPLLAHAKACGHRTVDGLGMLLHQAVPGFERWFGTRPEVTEELRDLVLADIGATSC